MSAAPTNPIDLDGLVQSLPACKRCRDCRRGCDTLLPKCRQCTKAGVECVFYDHGRNELLRRSYIAELVDHLRTLLPPSNQPSPTTLAARHASPSTVVAAHALPAVVAAVSPSVDDVAASANANAFAVPAVPRPESVFTEQPHFDHHFAYAAGAYRYLGSEACLIKSPKRAPVVMIQTPPEDDDEEWSLSWSAESPAKRYELVQVYLNVLHPLFPIVDPASRFLVLDVPDDLTDPEKYLLNMIYSIGCHVFSGKESTTSYKYRQQRESIKYHYFAATFFERAMEHLEAATMDTSIATLRAVLLFAINSLFDAKSGNIGQQIALAMRLALNLEDRVELHDVTPEDVDMVRAMHSTIFSIENEIASALDRPATFPEPDVALSFDPAKPADFFCSLYRLQHRYRKGDTSVKDLLPAFDEHALLNPGLRMVIHQTHLLVNPCWGSAWHVLEGVVAWTSIHIFLTPHWVYRAGCQLIQYMPEIFGGDLIQLYSNALVVLELSARKWPSSASLSTSLAEVMLHLKMKLRPSWSGHLDLGDVKI